MKPMSIIVTTLARSSTWFMIIFGSLIILNGHNTPGGGFQGGAVVATFVCFILAAWGSRRFASWVNSGLFFGLNVAGVLMFFAVSCLGFPNSFTYNFMAVPHSVGDVLGGWLPSCGTISLMDLAVGIAVIGGLVLAVIEIHKGGRLMDESQMGGECGHDR